MAERTVRVRLEAATQQFKQQFKQASATVKAEGRTMMGVAERNSAAFTAAGVAVGAAGAAIAMGLKSAGREAAAFESRLTKSTTLIGVSTSEMRKMGDAALRMSETGKGPQELADALFFAQSAGLRGADALDVVEQSTKAASIGLGDTATITDLVTSAVNAYGSETLSASDATDTLVGTVREGKAEADELAGSMGRVLPIASNMGVSLDQVGAAMAAMTRTGTNAAESATQLRAIMLGLLKPTQQAEEAMAGLGLSSSGLRDTIQEDGLWAALQQLKTAVGDNDDVMAQIFPNVRALAGVMDLTGASAEATGQIFENMTDVTGLTADGFEEWSKTTEASQKRFSASMEAVKIAAGESLQGPLKTVLDLGTGLNQSFVDLPPAAQQVATGLAAATSATALLGGAALVALPRIQQTKEALQAMGATKTLGALSKTKSFLMGPWGAAMGAAVVGIGLFAKAKAEQQERIEAVIASLDKETGALTDDTRAMLANELATSGALDRAEALGLAKGDLIAHLNGEEDATRRVNEAIQENLGTAGPAGDAAFKLTGFLRERNHELKAGQEQWRAENEALSASEGRYLDVAHAINSGLTPAEASLRMEMQALTDTQGEATDAAEDQTEGLEDLGDETEDVTSATDKLVDALDRLIGRHVDARGAQIKMLESLDAITEGVEENGTSLDINTESGRDNLSMVHDSINSITDLAAKRLDEGAAIGEVTSETLANVEALKEQMRQAGFTEQQVADLIAQYNLTPDEITTSIAADTADAEAAFNRILAQLTRITGTKHVRVEGSDALVPKGVTRHSGGWITANDRPSSGVASMMGLRGDEVPATLQTGELVLSRSQAAAYMGGGGSTSNTTQKTVNQNFAGQPDANQAGRAAALALRMS